MTKISAFFAFSIFSLAIVFSNIVTAQDTFTNTLSFESSTTEYFWQVTPWSACSVNCGNGIQTRQPLCLDNSGNSVALNLCEQHTPRPSPLTRNCNEANCEWLPCPSPHASHLSRIPGNLGNGDEREGREDNDNDGVNDAQDSDDGDASVQ